MESKKQLVLKNQGQDRNKDADVENGLEDTGRGKGKLGRSERVTWTYIHLSLIHISEPTRQAEISYAVFCLKKSVIIKKNGSEEPWGRRGIKTQTYYRTDLRIWEGGRVSCDKVRE